MSLRQELVAAVTTRLATLSGYTLDEWRVRWERPELPALTVRDVSVTTDPAPNRREGIRTRRLRLHIEIVLDEATATPTDACVALDQVLTAIGTDPTFGGLVDGTERVTESLIVDENLTWLSAAQLVLDLIYFEPAW